MATLTDDTLAANMTNQMQNIATQIQQLTTMTHTMMARPHGTTIIKRVTCVSPATLPTASERHTITGITTNLPTHRTPHRFNL